MATYKNLRDEIMLTLDIPTDMSGRMRDLIDLKMMRVLERILDKYKPNEMITKTSAVTVTKTTTEISIATDFGVSSYARILGVAVDKDTTDTLEEEWWEPIEYVSWVKLNNALGGNIRKNRTFTVDPSENVILRRWPSTTANDWDVFLWYYRVPDAITDSGEPPLPKLLHGIISVQTLLSFPQYFQGEKKSLFLELKDESRDYEQRLLKSRLFDLTLRPSALLAKPSTSTSLWPEHRIDP